LHVIDVAIADSISCGETFSLPMLRRTRAELVERTGRLAPVVEAKNLEAKNLEAKNLEAKDLEAKDPAGALPGPPPK
jgi:hypothetical protein